MCESIFLHVYTEIHLILIRGAHRWDKSQALFSSGMHLWFVRTFGRNEYVIDTDGVVVAVAASTEFLFSGPLSSKHVLGKC